MRTTPFSAVRAYVVDAVRLWGDVLSSGAFFSRWTVVVSFFVSVTILGMYVAAAGGGGYVRGLFLSVAVWIIAVVALAPVAVAERRIRSRRVRGVLVVASVLLVSVARPILHDVLAAELFGYPMLVGWGPRMITNVVCWLPVLSIVAAAALGYRAATVTRERLAGAIEDLARARLRLHRYATENEELLAETLPMLRMERDRMLAGRIDFEAVSTYAAQVRRASHLFDDRSRLVLEPQRAPDADADAPDRRRVPFLARLRPPPMLLVGGLVLAGSIAHLYTLGGIGIVLLAALIVPFSALLADLLTRRVLVAARPAVRGAWFLAVWTIMGLVVTLAAAVLVPGVGGERFVPLVAFPGVAVAAALGADAVHRASVNIRRLTTVLEADAQELAARTARVRARARDAADVLHGRVQGKCVLLAAAADEREVTAAEIDAFRDGTQEAFDEILSPAPEPVAVSPDVPALLAAWAGVVELSADISSDAAAALADDRLRHRVDGVLSEALVNVVKHSAARRARVRISTANAGEVRVRVTSPGVLRPAPTAQGRGISAMPGRATLRQMGADVELEVALTQDAEAPAGVSATGPSPSAAEVAGAVLRNRW